MKFTKKNLEAIEPTNKRQVFFDDDMKSLAIRVSDAGKISFYFTYYKKGEGQKRHWQFMGAYPKMTPEIARGQAQKLSHDVAMGVDLIQKARDEKEAKTGRTIAAIIRLFQEIHVDVKLKSSTQRLYRTIINNYIIPQLGNKSVEEIAHKDISSLHHSLRESPYMANRVVAVCSVFFNWCEKNGYRPRHSNPAEDIEKFKEKKRMEFLGAEEMKAIGEALAHLEMVGQVAPFPAAAIRLLLLTGARMSEILEMKWKYLDLESGRANLPDSKTGFKVLHLPAPAVDIFRNIPVLDENGYVFPSEESASGHLSSIRKPWSAVCKKAGIDGEGWRIHDLRHAFASAAVNSGKSLPIVGALLGHSQPSTTARYAHVAVNPAKQAAEETGREIANTMETLTPAYMRLRGPHASDEYNNGAHQCEEKRPIVRRRQKLNDGIAEDHPSL